MLLSSAPNKETTTTMTTISFSLNETMVLHMLRHIRRRSNDDEWSLMVYLCKTIVEVRKRKRKYPTYMYTNVHSTTIFEYVKICAEDALSLLKTYEAHEPALYIDEVQKEKTYTTERAIVRELILRYKKIENLFYKTFKEMLEKDEPLLQGFDTSKLTMTKDDDNEDGGGGVVLDPFFANIHVREGSLALRAIQYMSKKLQASFWTEDEIVLTEDVRQLRTSSLWKRYVQNDNVDDLYFFLCHLFLFFNFADGLVGENVSINMVSKAKIAEVKNFYAVQTANETIHAETYAKIYYTLLDTLKEIFKNDLGHDSSDSSNSSSSLSKSDGEAERVYEARMKRLKPFQNPTTLIETMSSLKRKKEWVSHFLNDDRLPYHVRLIATVAVEGIFFSSSFCSIFWLKKRGLMPGLTFSNELISRDEGLHCDFAALLYRLMIHSLDAELIATIIKHATECEIDFVNESMPETGFVGLNRVMMAQYVRFVANRFISRLVVDDKDVLCFLYLDESTLKPVANPFDFMHLISVDGKTNFFERTVSEYRMPKVVIPHSEYFDDENNLLALTHDSWYGKKDENNDDDDYRALSKSLIDIIHHRIDNNNTKCTNSHNPKRNTSFT